MVRKKIRRKLMRHQSQTVRMMKALTQPAQQIKIKERAYNAALVKTVSFGNIMTAGINTQEYMKGIDHQLRRKNQLNK